MKSPTFLVLTQYESSHWWFKARRVILRRLLDRLRLNKPTDILDVGCGTGGNFNMLSPLGNVYGLEIDEDIAKHIESGTYKEVQVGSFPENAMYKDQSFGVMVLLDVLEHIDDDSLAFQAIHSLLRPGGIAVITVPAYNFLWSKHDETIGHKRRYTAAELRSKAMTCGLDTVRTSYFNFFLFPFSLLAKIRLMLPGGDPMSIMREPPSFINSFFFHLFSLEKYPLTVINFPFGLSIFMVVRKPA